MGGSVSRSCGEVAVSLGVKNNADAKRAPRETHAAGQRAQGVLRDAVAVGEKVRKDYDASTARALYLATVLGAWHTVIGIGKIVSGVLGTSLFTCVNGLYTLFMGASRLVTATGAVRAGSGSSRRYARIAGAMLTVASLLYVAYATWSFFNPSRVYQKPAAFAIVAFTFLEIGLNIRHLIQTRGAKTAIEKALRIISLASSLIALSLAQEAFLALLGFPHNPTADACIRCLAGLIAASLGAYVVVRARPGSSTAHGWK